VNRVQRALNLAAQEIAPAAKAKLVNQIGPGPLLGATVLPEVRTVEFVVSVKTIMILPLPMMKPKMAIVLYMTVIP
jgi:hypothetical protein